MSGTEAAKMTIRSSKFNATVKKQQKKKATLDGSLPANPVNDRRIANAVTLKSTFCLP